MPTAAGPTHLLEAGQGRLTIVFLPETNENAATSLPLLALLAAQHPRTTFLAAGDAQLVKRLCSFPSAEAIVIEH